MKRPSPACARMRLSRTLKARSMPKETPTAGMSFEPKRPTRWSYLKQKKQLSAENWNRVLFPVSLRRSYELVPAPSRILFSWNN